MKRTLILVGAFVLAAGIAWAFAITTPDGHASQEAALGETQIHPTPLTPSFPDCPTPTGTCFVLGCSPGGGCITHDLGVSKCKQSVGGFFTCPQGQTVHYDACGCVGGCGPSISQLYCL